MTKKIVINDCHGGFSVSRAGLRWMREQGSEAAKNAVDVGEKYPNGTVNKGGILPDSIHMDVERDDPVLVRLVEEIGSKASGQLSSLKVVEIPDDVEWTIEEYDGAEWVAEKHRTWP